MREAFCFGEGRRGTVDSAGLIRRCNIFGASEDFEQLEIGRQSRKTDKKGYKK
jgi:hypothetical protein